MNMIGKTKKFSGYYPAGLFFSLNFPTSTFINCDCLCYGKRQKMPLNQSISQNSAPTNRGDSLPSPDAIALSWSIYCTSLSFVSFLIFTALFRTYSSE